MLGMCLSLKSKRHHQIACVVLLVPILIVPGDKSRAHSTHTANTLVSLYLIDAITSTETDAVRVLCNYNRLLQDGTFFSSLSQFYGAEHILSVRGEQSTSEEKQSSNTKNVIHRKPSKRFSIECAI